MKKHLSLILIFALLLICLAACSEEKAETTVPVPETEETTTAAPSESDEEMTEESTSETTVEPTQDEDYTIAYASVTTHEDGQGNTWLNVMVGYTNDSDKPLLLDYCDISVDADGEAFLTLTDVAAFPSVIAPGETGYYFEQVCVDVPDGAILGLIFEPAISPCEERAYFPVSDVLVLDAAFGIEVSGTVEVPAGTSGLVEICAVLFDANGQPVTVLYDYVDAAETAFILSGDRLPEGMTAEDFSDCVVYACLYEE